MDTPLLLAVALVAMFATAWTLPRTYASIERLAATGSGRFASLDGLRGLLACSVFVHHAWIARGFFAGAPWAKPASPLYHFAGDAAVAVFFMITGLLFWDKALAGRLRFRALLVSRMRRILPLQLFCLLTVVAICLALTGPTAASNSVLDSVAGALRWLARGLVDEPVIHGIGAGTVDAGVTWSLTIEWLFYLALLPLSWLFLRPGRFAGLVVAALLATLVLRRTGHFVAQAQMLVLLPFLVGMGCAYLVRSPAIAWRVGGPAVSAAIVALAACVVACYPIGNAGMLNLALAPGFAAIVLGNDLFGLLRTRAMRWLGHISFSVYLLHGIVLLGLLRGIDLVLPIATLDDGAWLLLVAAIGVAVVGFASASYLLIERAFFAGAALPVVRSSRRANAAVPVAPPLLRR